MRRMKIVHCLFSMEIGGAQILVVDLVNEMCLAHDVHLIVVNNYNEKLIRQIDKRVKIHYMRRKEGSRNPLPILKLNYLLIQLNPDIVHCHEPNMAKAIKAKRAKLVYTIHDVGIPVIFYDMYQSLVAISDAVYQDVTSRCDLPVTTVYNGVQIKSFRQRTEYSADTDNVYKLVQISRLMHEKKGQDILIHALHKVIREYHFSNVMLDFIGDGTSMHYLKNLINELGLGGHVRCIGERDRDWLFSNLSEYHILAQPSRYEGFGLTILEGFAAGLPVLASNIDGPAEIIHSLSGGFLFNNGDVDDCASELYKLLNLYHNNKIGELMQETVPLVKKKYSIESCAGGYLAEYRHLLNEPSVLV